VPRQLARLDAGGVRAIRLNLRGVADFAPSRARVERALRARARARLARRVFSDPGALPRSRQPSRSRRRVVLDHFGSPARTAHAPRRLFAAAGRSLESRRVVQALGAVSPRRRDAQRSRAAGSNCSARRLVWGSDWPWTQHERGKDYQRLREALDRWVGRGRRRAILWDNAARLYAFT
jgi:predicted TIM-barrel fold metal-dependent hydrolase